MTDCKCRQGDFNYLHMEDVKSIGTTQHFGEISVRRCKLCGTYWLRFFYENASFTASGRWYMLPILETDLESITVDNARAMFETAESYWAGGSYFKRGVHQSSGELDTWP